jgi:pSer/pThr/pTyr-binding forkhead associated (FHA) protein
VADEKQRTIRGELIGASRSPPAERSEALVYWIDFRGQRLELRPGALVIGRSTGCQLVLDDALVSRRHAQVVMSERDVRIEDLGSANGVYVNGDRLTQSRALSPGDRIVVGQQELVFRAGSRKNEVHERGRLTAVTLSGLDSDKMLGREGLVPGDLESEATQQSDALQLLGGVADKVLAFGRGEDAERILGVLLRNVLARAQANGRLEPALADKAAEYAIKIAAVTGNGKWVDYAIELFMPLGRPLPAVAIDQLYTVLRSVSSISLAGLRGYCAKLRLVQDQLGPNERFLTQRIEGLERLASLK